MSGSIAKVFNPLGVDPVGGAIEKAVGGGKDKKGSPPPATPAPGKGSQDRVTGLERNRQDVKRRAGGASVALSSEDRDTLSRASTREGQKEREREGRIGRGASRRLLG